MKLFKSFLLFYLLLCPRFPLIFLDHKAYHHDHQNETKKTKAVFDFGESRISVVRELEDVAGQLQRIEVDLNDDGTGNIVLTTQPPRRTWMKTLPKALEEVVDVGHLQKNVA